MMETFRFRTAKDSSNSITMLLYQIMIGITRTIVMVAGVDNDWEVVHEEIL